VKFYELDFAPHRGISPWAMAALVCGAAAIAAGAAAYLHVATEVTSLHAQANDMRARLMIEQPTARPTATVPARQVQAVNAAVAALNTPWQPLLRALEASRPQAASLMQVEARPADAVLVVTAQAQDVGTLLDFMSALSHEAPFVEVRPVRQETVGDGPDSRRQATFEARWGEAP
jgi:hypothetical protein